MVDILLTCVTNLNFKGKSSIKRAKVLIRSLILFYAWWNFFLKIKVCHFNYNKHLSIRLTGCNVTKQIVKAPRPLVLETVRCWREMYDVMSMPNGKSHFFLKMLLVALVGQLTDVNHLLPTWNRLYLDSSSVVGSGCFIAGPQFQPTLAHDNFYQRYQRLCHSF